MPVAPATRPSLRFRFTTPVRGSTKEWSTRMHFDGHDSPTDAEFLALFDAVKVALRGCVSSRSSLLGAVGYHPGSEVPVWSGGVGGAGNCLVAGDSHSTPGDCATLIRFSTTQRTSKNHPIYLFNYFHDAWSAVNAPDTVDPQMKFDLEALATFVLNGSWSDGTHTVRRCGPYGAVAQTRLVEPLITHRDFPR